MGKEPGEREAAAKDRVREWNEEVQPPAAHCTTAWPEFGAVSAKERYQMAPGLPHMLHSIPNIVVHPVVPPRDAFGYSATPPFVQTAMRTFDWPVPNMLGIPQRHAKKQRTNSDSAIYEMERATQPRTWPAGHMASRSFPQPGDEALLKDMSRQAELFHRTSAAHFERASYHGDSMEVEMTMPYNVHSPEQARHATDARAQSYRDSAATSSSNEKPVVPFIWHFGTNTRESCEQQSSPKSYWLRRHSDSVVSSKPKDEALSRTRSTGDRVQTDDGPASPVSPMMRQGSTGTMKKQLKLKKYLQKRYQQSLTDDDVFLDKLPPETPGPGGKLGRKNCFTFSLSSESEDHEAVDLCRQPKDDALPDVLTIKTEPSSPFSVDPALDVESDASVFASPLLSLSPFLPNSASPRCQRNVFQFHSPSHLAGSPLTSQKTDTGSSGSIADVDMGKPSVGSIHRPIVDSTGKGETGPDRWADWGLGRGDSAAASPDRGSGTKTKRKSEKPKLEKIGRSQSIDSYGHLPYHPLDGSAPLPPFSSMLKHPSFTHLHVAPFHTPAPSPVFLPFPSGPPPPPLQWPSLCNPGMPPQQPSPRQPIDKAIKPDPSKVVYCLFTEKVEEQRRAEDKTYVCPVCSQAFPSYNYLANHMVNHLPSEVVSKGPGDTNKVRNVSIQHLITLKRTQYATMRQGNSAVVPPACTTKYALQ